jgi:transcriptional regulator with XRE-family HTH domain
MMASPLHVPPTVFRIALGLPEARLDHGLSQLQLAALSGVSATTIQKVERGGRVDPALLIRLGEVLVVLDVYRPPPLALEDELHTLIDGRWSS